MSTQINFTVNINLPSNLPKLEEIIRMAIEASTEALLQQAEAAVAAEKAEVAAAIEALSSTVSALNQSVSTLNTNISSLQSEVSTSREQIAALEAQIAQSTGISDAERTEWNSRIVALTAQINAIHTATEQVTVAGGEVAGAASNVADAGAAIVVPVETPTEAVTDSPVGTPVEGAVGEPTAEAPMEIVEGVVQ